MPSKVIMDVKKQQADELSKIFQSSGAYLFDYRGLTVAEMNDLRERVKNLGANVKVFKNRLAIKYFEKERKPQGRDLFKGPLAVAYANDNFVEVAKVMVDFEKENNNVQIMAGFIEQTYVDKDKIKHVATLPGKEQLLAQLAFLISMPLKKMGMALSAPLRNMLILMKNLKDKKEKEEKNNG
ncbi:MAG: 50S ribosomal protein L10 [Candidatus Aminicenantes bacterium]|nr:50S ribosomal protein L10 [Candidatus Aminicenantes bacterium]NIM79790.1 50S ribosomal protein L10 [Candidatus Aminicenantes bacterium]NIN19118.1 50S ribosomal protein L10 [Candidatus Aminicenantes bacterium]NIN43020.1 50S ribosomal protein L10 [Candidatus Aminicenantes bacterium]NIN85763.1 50S ribosomal protein L10 [Candidatus Aminicenantes bacterium]